MQDFKLEPADKYFIYNKGIITSEKIKILTNLYQPIIGYTAISLYLTFLKNTDNNLFLSFLNNLYILVTFLNFITVSCICKPPIEHLLLLFLIFYMPTLLKLALL